MAIKPRKNDDPRMPEYWEPADAQAIQAVVRGDATDYQQQRAMSFIVNKLCHTYDLSYRPVPQDTAFAEGRRFVGLQLVKLININAGLLKK
jgi:hypothetical protein